MNFLLLSLLPAMAVAITDFATCDATPTLACLAADDCVTAGLPAGTPCNSDATTPIGAAPAAPGCCIAAATTTTAATTVAGSVTTVAGSTTCVDKLNPLTGVSDCPARASLCNNSVYLDVMRDQCPKTCNFCSSTGTGTSTNSTITSCVDRVNPNTGISDCPTMKAYCNNSIYLPLMRIQCPASCGFCTSG